MIKKISFLMIVALGVSSCHSDPDKEDPKEQNDLELAPQGNYTVVSEEQFDAAGMKLGTPDSMIFDQVVVGSGYITASSKGTSLISTLVPGQVKSIFVSPGDYVRQGQALFSIEGNEIIELQQEYAEAFHLLTVLESDYIRQKELEKEKVTSTKSFLQAQSEYKVMQSKLESLKARLSLLNISPEGIQNGKIQKGLTISAPINGSICDMQLAIGQQVQSDEELLKIINPKEFRLELNIFEKDIEALVLGQEVRLLGANTYMEGAVAKLSRIGRTVDRATRTVKCSAELNKAEKVKYLNNQYVETEVVTCFRKVQAISDQALIVEDERNYILVLEKKEENSYYFRKTQVKLGAVQNGFAELLESINGEILVEGGYNLPTDH